jgi:hypothetical protein
MSAPIPTRRTFVRGETVLVEATVVSWEDGQPYGSVTVEIPSATDELFLTDGVTAIVPQAIVCAPGALWPGYADEFGDDDEED